MRRQPNSHHCFVCGVRNVSGLRVVFYDTVDSDDRASIEARFTGQSEHQGYPGRMHGGVATAVLDETIGRAINSATPDEGPTVWGVAIELNVKFVRPVPLEVPLVARGRLEGPARRLFSGSGEIYLPDGTIAVSATGRYMRVPLDQISEIDPDRLGWRVYDDDELELDPRPAVDRRAIEAG